MTNRADAELYLRLVGERSLIGAPTQPIHPMHQNSVHDVASAFVAVDALPVEVAQAIVDDYQLAIMVRHGGPPFLPGRPFGGARPSPALPITPPRVVVCDRDFEQPWGRLRVHYVSLTDRSTTVALTATETTPGALLGNNPGAGQAPLTDDQGRVEISHFSGGNSNFGDFDGALKTFAPLSRTTQWIDMPAGRIELGAAVTPPNVEIEALAPTDPAEHYLWSLLTRANHGHPFHMFFDAGRLDANIDALVSIGAIPADAPFLDDLRAVANNLSGSPQSITALPHPWSALRSQTGRTNGPTGIIGLGVVTPPFDGMVLSFDALVSSRERFAVQVSMTPGSGFAPMGLESDLGATRVAWWADDDAGNTYLGGTGGWGGDAQFAEGEVMFNPPLDPRATELRLLPTGRNHRAVITIPLVFGERAP